MSFGTAKWSVISGVYETDKLMIKEILLNEAENILTLLS